MKRIVYVRELDNKIYNNIEDVIKDYKCPGPCEDGLCKLNPMVTLPNGNVTHMCNLEYAVLHPEEVCHALNITPRIEDAVSISNKYIALISSHAVRDCQVCTNTDCDPTSDDWYDFEHPDIYLGIFKATSQTEALETAAKFAQTDKANIKIIPIASL